MEDSLKGILVTATIIGLFITCIINFIVSFPQEQGVSFNGQSQDSYLIINNTNTDIISSLESLNNQSSSAFDQWDVTTGFMGTNQLKQGQSGINGHVGNIFTNLIIIAKQLFTANSPIIYALLVLSVLATGFLIYVVIKFVRTGN
jgi:hypothetical protein